MKYRRLVVTQRGGPEMLQIIEDELRPPAAGEARVQVQTAQPGCSNISERS